MNVCRRKCCEALAHCPPEHCVRDIRNRHMQIFEDRARFGYAERFENRNRANQVGTFYGFSDCANAIPTYET